MTHNFSGNDISRMPCLDGLRGLAALLVVLGHAHEFGFSQFLDETLSNYGVLIFFVLSGFLMGVIYLPQSADDVAVRSYVSSRVARIVPLYYAVVLSSFVVFTYFDKNFVYQISMLQLGRLLTFNGSVSVFWSIGPEFQFYFVFIFIWYLYDRFPSRVPFFAAVIGFSALALSLVGSLPGIVVFSKFHVFSCGLLAALLRLRLRRLTVLAIALLNCVAVVALFFMLNVKWSSLLFGEVIIDLVNDPALSTFYGNVGRVLLVGFIVFALSYSSKIGDLIFANPLSVAIGQCSFSVYLLHEIVYYIMSRFGVMYDWSVVGRTSFSLFVILVVSCLSYRLFETPSRAFVRQAMKRRGA